MKKIIKEIARIDKELEKRDKSALSRYNKGEKVHLKQLAFHRCQKRNKWVFGGNRSGKTECGAVEAVWLARGIHPYLKNKDDVCGWVVSLSAQVQRDVAQQKILKYLDKSWIKEVVMSSGRRSDAEYGVIDYIVVKNVFGGLSRIGFRNCEAGRDKFQGTSLDFVWFDEEPPYEIYRECRMRVMDRKGRIFGTMTPLSGLTWVYDEIYLNAAGDDEVWCLFMEWADNPWLDGEEIKLLTEYMPEDELESRRYGRFVSESGPVYSEFDPSVHVIDPFDVPQEWQDALSIDPGLNNPLSCHWYAIDGDGVVYVVAEHYAAKKDVAWHAERIKEISARLNWHTDGKGRLDAFIDSAANQRTLAASKSVSELFSEQGINVNSRVNKDLYSGINRVKQYLKISPLGPRLYIFRSCVNLIRELKSYRWGSNDLPAKKDDHALDELRYYLCSRPEPRKPPEEKSVIARDKEKLIRRLRANR